MQQGGLSKKVGNRWEVDMSFVQARSANVENFRKTSQLSSSVEYADPTQLNLTVDELKSGRSDVDPTRKEMYTT